MYDPPTICEICPQKHPIVFYQARKTCPIVCIPASVVGETTHKKPVGVRLLSLPNTRSGSLVLSLTALIFIQKFPVWITKNGVAIGWEKHQNLFALGCQRRGIYKRSDFLITVPTLSAMPICVWERSGSFAGCQTRSRA